MLENGTEADRHVLNKAYEATHVGDPLDEVTKAADELDAYIRKSRRDGETVEDAEFRLGGGKGDIEPDVEYARLYTAATSGRL